MQFVNDDMDELFRRAAENYPLKEEGADWNKVLQQLQVAEGDDRQKSSSKNNKKHFLWLLLLLPLTFICNKYRGSDTHQQVVAVEDKMQPQSTIQVNEEPGFNQSATVKKEVNNSKKVHSNNNEVVLKQQQESKEQKSLLPTENFGVKENKASAGNRTKSSEQQQIKNKKNQRNYVIKDKRKNKETASAPFFNNRLDQITAKQKAAIGKIDQQNNPEQNDAISSNKEKQKDSSAVVPAPQNAVSAATDTAANSTPLSAKKVKQKRLYAGVIAGPDVSKIKSSKIQGAGFSAGLIAGYNISSKWSVEAGLLWDKKKYYAEGAYFDTSKMMLPVHSKIINGDGDCSMIEIPLNIRYHFAAAQGHNWFASAGVTSYLMLKEDYNYWYERYGGTYYSYKEYTHSSQDWLSVLTVSMGYQKKLGNIGNLRLEPYLKLPLRGVGIGKLPMSSGGVYIGITRPIR